MWGLSSAMIISLYSLSRKGDKSSSDSVLLPMCRQYKKRNPGTRHPLILQTAFVNIQLHIPRETKVFIWGTLQQQQQQEEFLDLLI